MSHMHNDSSDEEVPMVETEAERPVLTHKTCTQCAIKKSISEFRPLTMNLKGQLNYAGKCRVCLAKYDADRYQRKHPNSRNKRGSKSQFDDPAVYNPIIDMLATGVSVRSVALALGYPYTTFYSAYRNGKFTPRPQTVVDGSDDE